MDYENMITFKDTVVEKNGLRPYYALNVRLAYNFTDPKWAKGSSNVATLPVVAKLCVSNRVDMNPDNISVMAVKKSAFGTWAALANDINLNLNDATDTLANNITLTLYDPQATYIGQMVYYMDEFVDEKKNLLIKPFTPEFDEGRSCDFYTGMRMLKKYNVRYYYIETATAYETQFSYDLNNMTPQTSESSGFWWKLILFIIIVGIIGYFIYRYFMGPRDSDGGDDETYRGFPQNQDDMTELKEVIPADKFLKKPVPEPKDEEKIPPLLGKNY